MLEHGLIEAASYKHYRPQTPILELTDFGIDTKEYEDVTMSHVPNYRKKKKEDANKKTQTEDKDMVSSPISNPCSNSIKNDDTGSFQSSLESPGTRSGDSTLTRDSAIPESITSSSSPEKSNSLSSIQPNDLTTTEEGTKTKQEKGKDGLRGEQSTKSELDDGNNTPGSVKSLEEDLLALIDQELYGPYFEGRKLSETDDVDQTSRTNSSSSLKSKPKQTEDVTAKVLTGPRSTGDTINSTSRETSPDQKKKKVCSEEDEAEGSSPRLSGAEDFVVLQNCPSLSTIKADDFGFPLSLFGKVRYLNSKRCFI